MIKNMIKKMIKKNFTKTIAQKKESMRNWLKNEWSRNEKNGKWLIKENYEITYDELYGLILLRNNKTIKINSLSLEALNNLISIIN